MEVSRAVADDRTGIRLSPRTTLGDIHEEGLEETYGSLVDHLAALGLGYVHVMEARE